MIMMMLIILIIMRWFHPVGSHHRGVYCILFFLFFLLLLCPFFLWWLVGTIRSSVVRAAQSEISPFSFLPSCSTRSPSVPTLPVISLGSAALLLYGSSYSTVGHDSRTRTLLSFPFPFPFTVPFLSCRPVDDGRRSRKTNSYQ